MRLVAITSVAVVITVCCCAYLAFSRPAMAAATEKPAGLRHVVLFKFKDSTTPAQVAEVVEAFRGLKSQIDVIQDFEYGTDVSVENKSQGFTHCFFATFRDAAGRGRGVRTSGRQRGDRGGPREGGVR